MRTRAVATFALAVALTAGAGCSDQTPVGPTTPPSLARVGGGGGAGGARRHVILMREGRTSIADLAARVHALGGRVMREHADIGVLTVSGLSDDALASLAARGDVEAVEADQRVRMIPPLGALGTQRLTAQTDQSGAFFFPAFQWNMRQIRADKAWLVTHQGAGALVCILDTGIDPDHIDLAGKIDLGLSTSFVDSEPDVLDRAGHGTFVAGIISSNGLGVASVAPDARLCALKVLDQTGVGSFSDLIAAIVYAAQHHVDVINMSLNAYFPIQTRDDLELVAAVQRAIDFALRRGTLPVAAAGNDTANLATDPRNFISIPAQLRGVVSVGATAPINQMDFDRIAGYSDVGFPGVDVFAPGGDFIPGQSVQQDLIISPCSGLVCGGEDIYLIGAGTSFAAPHVAGQAAVIISDARHRIGPVLLTACIEATADHPTGRFIDPLYGHGRIDVLKSALCRR